MSIPLSPNQAATLSKGAQAFLHAAPSMRLPKFVYRYLARPANVTKMRALFQTGEDKVEEALMKEHGLTLTRRVVSDVHVLVITPPRIAPGMEGTTILNIHGGGFVLGTARDRTALLTAAELGVTVWSIDYMLAPEAKFPFAINQCLSVYRSMVREVRPDRIGAVSSSAGGQLLLAMLLLAHKEGLPMPAALTMYTPAADISGVGNSAKFNDGRDVMPFEMTLSLVKQNYLGEADPKSAELSPVYADYPSNFPPTVITTGTRDLILSNGVRLYWKLRDAGVPSELLVTEGGWHGYNWEPELFEAKRVRAAVAEFMRRHIPSY
jgi:acetyl esterase/lipase